MNASASADAQLEHHYRVLYKPATDNFCIKYLYLERFVCFADPVSDFDGEKWLLLSTTSWLGGRNDALAVMYVVVAAFSFVFAAVLAAAQRYFRTEHRRRRDRRRATAAAERAARGESVDDGAARRPTADDERKAGTAPRAN
jgi:hypothetical protein